MLEYRLYRLDENNRIIAAVEAVLPDDEAAIREAIRIDHAAVIEIWNGARLVARVDPSHQRIEDSEAADNASGSSRSGRSTNS